MAEWARRMPCRRSVSTRGRDLRAGLQRAVAQMAVVSDQVAVLLRVGHLELEAVADDLARVADLAAGLAVERRAVEHDRDRLVVADLGQLIEQVVLRDDAADLGRRLGRFVAEELGGLEGLLQRVDRAGLEDDVGDLAGLFAVLFHRLAEAVPVEREVLLGGHALDQLGREAVGRVQVGRVVARDDHAAGRSSSRRTSCRSASGPRRSCRRTSSLRP